ncbi:hypothetical protein OEZ86_003058 [Tetradesmus obliquus]|nr:hypothetical protein OEZ86_003058 [Tetradesmus obliquus]
MWKPGCMVQRVPSWDGAVASNSSCSACWGVGRSNSCLHADQQHGVSLQSCELFCIRTQATTLPAAAASQHY